MATLDVGAAPLTPSKHQIQLRRFSFAAPSSPPPTDYTGKDIDSADAHQQRS